MLKMVNRESEMDWSPSEITMLAGMLFDAFLLGVGVGRGEVTAKTNTTEEK
jgi:hypothetical protein